MNILVIGEANTWFDHHVTASLREMGHNISIFHYGNAVGEYYSRERRGEREQKNRDLLRQAVELKEDHRLELIFCYVYDDFLLPQTAAALRALDVPMFNYNVDMTNQWYRQIRTARYFTGMLCAQRVHMDDLARYGTPVYYFPMAALVVSSAIARSGIVEAAMRPITPKLRTTSTQVPVLVGCVLLLSMVTKNVGALAIFIPVALQLARRTKTSPSSLLMPMAFASLLGGIVTLVGTSPNILVAKVRADTLGKPFGLFDFTPVGLSIALVGFLFLMVGWRLLPRGRRAAPDMAAAFNLEDYTAEARVEPGSVASGRTVGQIEAMAEGDVQVGLVVRERFRRFAPTADWVLRDDDVLLLRGEPTDLERLVARARLALVGGGKGDAKVVEGVVTADSPLVGQTLDHAQLEERFAIGVLAVSRSGQHIRQRLGTVRMRAGDVIVIRSASPNLPDIMGELRILPLAGRTISLGRNDRSFVPALVLAAAMVLVALHVLPVAVAFFGAAVVLLLLRVMTMHEAYETVEWHVLILLGALIPVSHAIHDTGGTDLIAGWMAIAVQGLPGVGALGVVLILTMALTPFLHNAPAVPDHGAHRGEPGR